MPFSCIIVDHDLNALAKLAEYINRSPFLKLEKSFDNAIAALESIQLMNHPVDILFTEVEMPGLSGFQLAQKIPHQVGLLVLMSSHIHYAAEGYYYNARQFLSKPFDDQRLNKVVNHIIQQINSGGDFIMIRLSGKNQSVKIWLKDIISVQSASNYLKVHTADKTYVPYGSLQAMQESLSHCNEFMRISRSVIINTSYIMSTDRYRIKLAHNIQVNVGESYQKAFDHYIRKTTMGNATHYSNKNQLSEK